MSAPRISRSPDLQKLRDEGYDISIKSGHLLLRAPYLNAQRQVKQGTLVTPLDLVGERTARPSSHVVSFIGEQPCHKDGSEIAQIRHAVGDQKLAEGLVVNRSFSNKPPEGYVDYFQKMSTYAAIISGPAAALDPNATAKTHRVTTSDDDEADSVFQYPDTASTRAGIVVASNKVKGQRLGIVGLGGTGTYVLDFVSKSPAAEIHIFDGDVFRQHNAFRAPGAPGLEDLERHEKKVERFGQIYSRMHSRIMVHPYHVDESNVGELEGVDFVFICIDKSAPKRVIIEHLLARGVRFVDVGMSVELVDSELVAIVRTTSSTPEKHDHVARCIAFRDAEEDEYARNIQVAELNALNAAHAVIKWKKLSGIYQDLEREHQSTYTLNMNMLLREESPGAPDASAPGVNTAAEEPEDAT